jgi:general stress protein 26
MNRMDKTVLDFLSKDRIAVISVSLEDGAVHSATVHFSHQNDPFKFYIQTSSDTLKAQPFLNGQTGQGALVVGFSEEEWVTFQAHGTIRAILDQEELEKICKIHYQKLPDAEKRKGPDTVFLEFTPTWWRYTDFKSKPKTVINS